jgi:predicted DNA-binding protein
VIIIRKTQEKTIQITVKVKESTYQSLNKYAAKSGRPLAEIVRGFIDKGMNIEGYKEEIDFIRRNIREEINAILKPRTERLIKLFLKGGIAGAAGYFLNAVALSEFVSPQRQREFEEILTRSKRLGVQYFKMPSEEAINLLDSDNNI